MMAPAKKLKPRWEDAGPDGNQICVLDGSVVATLTRGSAGWYAHGCMGDWEDVQLGVHRTKTDAKRRVNEWIEENV